ncbi:MAG: histidinol dehydrogenase [Clostridia bacterium]|nr:histidinol dehydrogenase [Clostridia bacterium]
MIKIYEGGLKAEDIFDRTEEKNTVGEIVADIIANVRKNGDKALREYSAKFDGAELDSLEVSEQEIDEAFAALEPEFVAIIEEAAENIREFHRHQVRTGFAITPRDGVVLGQRVIPLERVGLYVPGGTASYPSSVLMNCIPAKLAGCDEIVMVTPPSKDGSIKPAILVAAKIAGVDRIFKVGGAQAVAALAYSTETIPQVDKIVGPGNVFVAEAKRQVFGTVAIDMIAGPSEILVIADGTCNPKYVAADMLSQAEHDKNASAVLVTDSLDLAKAVSAELEVQIPQLSRAEIARVSVDNNGKIIVVDDLKKAIEMSNAIAPEHLEVCVDRPFDLLPLIRNAGSVFLGKNCPEALGDYFAGPNHTLPTSGTARFSSPLSVDDFVKKSSFMSYSQQALESVYEKIDAFAQKEGLQAHGKSVTVRFED